MSISIWAMAGTFVVAAILRFPISIMMFACGLVYLLVSKQDLGLVVDQTLNSTYQLFVLLAVPMFILAGNVMNAATISERLWAAADAVASLADLPAAAFQARRRAAMAHAGRYDWNAVVRRYRDEYHQIQPRATQTAGSVR